jgi:hypothetical protein
MLMARSSPSVHLAQLVSTTSAPAPSQGLANPWRGITLTPFPTLEKQEIPNLENWDLYLHQNQKNSKKSFAFVFAYIYKLVKKVNT